MSFPLADGPGPFPDSTYEAAAWLLIAVVVLGGTVAGFASFTHLDAHARFLINDPARYLSAADTDPDQSTDTLVFSRQMIDRLNWASLPSLGPGSRADERLYCFGVSDGVVTKLELVHDITESEHGSVADSCTDLLGGVEVDGFLHTQPGRSDELSDEDRDMESAVTYSCIMYAEAAASPFGSVDGIRCWMVTGVGEDAVFTEIPVRVR